MQKSASTIRGVKQSQLYVPRRERTHSLFSSKRIDKEYSDGWYKSVFCTGPGSMGRIEPRGKGGKYSR